MHDPSPNGRTILDLLRAEGRALSAYQILGALAGTSIRAPTQVYRALGQLIEAGQVHRVHSLNAFTACGTQHDHSRPGFLICRSCGTVSEFEDRAIDRLPRKLLEDGFETESLCLEISGLCSACRAHPHEPYQGAH